MSSSSFAREAHDLIVIPTDWSGAAIDAETTPHQACGGGERRTPAYHKRQDDNPQEQGITVAPFKVEVLVLIRKSEKEKLLLSLSN
jgi:hypothetical protein